MMGNLLDTLISIDAKLDDLDMALITRYPNHATKASIEMRVLLASAMDQISKSNGGHSHD